MTYQKLSAIAGAILLVTSSSVAAKEDVAVTRASNYAVRAATVTVIEPERTGCTQLEMSAGVERQMCGKMALHEVIQKLNSSAAD